MKTYQTRSGRSVVKPKKIEVENVNMNIQVSEIPVQKQGIKTQVKASGTRKTLNLTQTREPTQAKRTSILQPADANPLRTSNGFQSPVKGTSGTQFKVPFKESSDSSSVIDSSPLQRLDNFSACEAGSESKIEYSHSASRPSDSSSAEDSVKSSLGSCSSNPVKGSTDSSWGKGSEDSSSVPSSTLILEVKDCYLGKEANESTLVKGIRESHLSKRSKQSVPIRGSSESNVGSAKSRVIKESSSEKLKDSSLVRRSRKPSRVESSTDCSLISSQSTSGPTDNLQQSSTAKESSDSSSCKGLGETGSITALSPSVIVVKEISFGKGSNEPSSVKDLKERHPVKRSKQPLPVRGLSESISGTAKVRVMKESTHDEVTQESCSLKRPRKSSPRKRVIVSSTVTKNLGESSSTGEPEGVPPSEADNSSVGQLLQVEHTAGNDNPETEWWTGDMAWARVGKHPYWPCLVTLDPEERIFSRIRGAGSGSRLPGREIHVRFFADNGLRSWVHTSCLRRFEGRVEFQLEADRIYCLPKKKNKAQQAFFVKAASRNHWEEAVLEAESYTDKPRRARLDLFEKAYPQNQAKVSTLSTTNSAKKMPKIKSKFPESAKKTTPQKESTIVSKSLEKLTVKSKASKALTKLPKAPERVAGITKDSSSTEALPSNGTEIPSTALKSPDIPNPPKKSTRVPKTLKKSASVLKSKALEAIDVPTTGTKALELPTPALKSTEKPAKPSRVSKKNIEAIDTSKESAVAVSKVDETQKNPKEVSEVASSAEKLVEESTISKMPLEVRDPAKKKKGDFSGGKTSQVLKSDPEKEDPKPSTSGSNQTLTLENVPYAVGDIVWARVGNYPFWPAMVIWDPETESYKKQVQDRISIHIQFYGDNGRRSWLAVQRVQKFAGMASFFSDTQSQNKGAYVVKRSLTIQWENAVTEAEGFITSPRSARIEYFQENYPIHKGSKRSRPHVPQQLTLPTQPVLQDKADEPGPSSRKLENGANREDVDTQPPKKKGKTQEPGSSSHKLENGANSEDVGTKPPPKKKVRRTKKKVTREDLAKAYREFSFNSYNFARRKYPNYTDQEIENFLQLLWDNKPDHDKARFIPMIDY